MDAGDAAEAPLPELEFGDGGSSGWLSQRVIGAARDDDDECVSEGGEGGEEGFPLSMTQVRRPLPLRGAGEEEADDEEETDEWDSSSGSSDSDGDGVDIVEEEDSAPAQRTHRVAVAAAADDDVVVIVDDDEDGDGIENRAPAAHAGGGLVSPPPSARNAAAILMASARQLQAGSSRVGSGSGKVASSATAPSAAPLASTGSGASPGMLSGRRGQLTLAGASSSSSSSSPSLSAPRAASAGASTGGGGGGGSRPAGRVRKKRSSGGAFSSSSSSSRPLPFYKVLPRTGIVVDGFAFAPGAYRHFILTHFHSDHYGGLTKHWSAGTIYCTPVTASLVALRLGVSPRYLHPIPLDTPTLINGCTVTLVDANHCPGAAMVHVQLPPPALSNTSNGACYLHVGDFRWTRRMTRHPLLAGARAAARGVAVAPPPGNLSAPAPAAAVPWAGSLSSAIPPPAPSSSASGPPQPLPVPLPLPLPRRIDCLYLDTTYADPTYAFPPQEACIQAVVQTATYYARDKHVLLLFGSYAIGKERVFLEVARALGPSERIYVDRAKYRALQCCDLPPEDARRLTTDPSMARIHVVPMGYLTLGRLHDRLKALTAPTAGAALEGLAAAADAPAARTPAPKRARAASALPLSSTPVAARGTAKAAAASSGRGGGIAGTGISRSNKRTTLRGAGFASLLAASATAATTSTPSEGEAAIASGAAHDDEEELAALMAERDGTGTHAPPSSGADHVAVGAARGSDGGAEVASNAFDELMRSSAALTAAAGSDTAPSGATCGPYHSIVAFKPTGWSHAAAVGGSGGGAYRGRGDDLAPGDTSDVLSVQARVAAGAALGAWSRQAGAEDAARQAAPSVVAAARDAAVAVADIVEERRAGAVQALVAVPQDELLGTQAAAAAAASGWGIGVPAHWSHGHPSAPLRPDVPGHASSGPASGAAASASSASDASSMALLDLISGARGRASGVAAGFNGVSVAASAPQPAAAAASVVVHTVRMTRQCRAGGARCRARPPPPPPAAAAASASRLALEHAAMQALDGVDSVSGHKRPAAAAAPSVVASAAVGALAPGGVTLFSVPYSEHSSFVELRECVAWLDPVTIIPTVNCRSKEDADALVALLRGGGAGGATA